MKKLIIIILILSLRNGVGAPEITNHHVGRSIHSVYHKQKVIMSVAYVESRHNPGAINVQEGAIGLMQVRDIMESHLNTKYGMNYTLSDRLDSVKSIEMFCLLMDNRNPEYDLVLAGNLWNRGRFAYDTTIYVIKLQQIYKQLF